MCPPIINDVWVYNGDDDTLFRLVNPRRVALQGQGLYAPRTRKRRGADAPFRRLIPTADELWKILAWVRSAYDGDPKYKFGSPPPPPPPPDE